uniref:Uncharacterized protein n=1 Tax=Ananas comosus var. bracteatus TaxID=296719 RepID=A0A6V7Q325_ANACO|nr:unnamed protein product [Ananas comosus var. bracteatus]
MRHYVRRSVPAQPAEVPEQAGSSEVQELRAQMTALVGVVQRQGSQIERLQGRLERLVAAAAATAIEGRGPPAPSIRALDAAEGEGLAAVPVAVHSPSVSVPVAASSSVILGVTAEELGPSGKIGGVGGRTHWELYLYSSHPVWFWGTGIHESGPADDRGRGLAP